MYARIASGIWCAIFITLHYVHINNHQWTIANKCVQTNCWTSSLSFSSSLKWTHVDRRHTVEEAVTMKWNATEAVILRNSAQRQSHFLWKIHYFSLSLCVHCFHSVERKEKIMRRKKIIAFKESHNFFPPFEVMIQRWEMQLNEIATKQKESTHKKIRIYNHCHGRHRWLRFIHKEFT